MKRSLSFFLLPLFLVAPPGPGPDPRPASELVAELRASIDSGDLESAIRAGEKAIGLDPLNSEPHDLLGRAYGLKAQESQLLEQIRLARKARAFFARAVELDSSNVSALADLTTYDIRAPAALGGGKAKARREAQKVLDLDPARGHELLGELAEHEKDPVTAEGHYREAIAAAPHAMRARRAFSSFLIRRQRYVDARQLWFEAREADASDSNAPYELAGIALAWGQGLAAALEDLEASLSLPERPNGPSRAEVHRRIALVCNKLGRKEQEKAALEEALRLEPYHADWRKALARLRR
ncbi:MAG TPA: hypothetical protein VGL03_09350 [Thermoanaerobaculia bacterium]